MSSQSTLGLAALRGEISDFVGSKSVGTRTPRWLLHHGYWLQQYPTILKGLLYAILVPRTHPRVADTLLQLQLDCILSTISNH
jgi:hypothetical protein